MLSPVEKARTGIAATQSARRICGACDCGPDGDRLANQLTTEDPAMPPHRLCSRFIVSPGDCGYHGQGHQLHLIGYGRRARLRVRGQTAESPAIPPADRCLDAEHVEPDAASARACASGAVRLTCGHGG